MHAMNDRQLKKSLAKFMTRYVIVHSNYLIILLRFRLSRYLVALI